MAGSTRRCRLRGPRRRPAVGAAGSLWGAGLRRPTGCGRSRTGGACSPTRSSGGYSPTSRRRIMRSTCQRRRRSRKGMGATSRRRHPILVIN